VEKIEILTEAPENKKLKKRVWPGNAFLANAYHPPSPLSIIIVGPELALMRNPSLTTIVSEAASMRLRALSPHGAPMRPKASERIVQQTGQELSTIKSTAYSAKK
jgi:hypothetical protein